MNADITIGTPILGTGEHFTVRYKLMPNGAWQDYGTVTNTTFTITGLDAGGTYEIEITYVLADGTECTPLIKTITIPETWPPPVQCDCIDVTGSYIQVNCDNSITINIAFTENEIDACGYRITYTLADGSTNVVNYTTLPNPLVIPVPTPKNVHVKIEVYCCTSDTWITCYDSDIVDIRDCDCEHALIITDDGFEIGIDGEVTYHVTFIPSIPDVSPYQIQFMPHIGMPSNILTQTVNSGGTYYFTLPRGTDLSAGKWLTVVSNPCGQDETNGIW